MFVRIHEQHLVDTVYIGGVTVVADETLTTDPLPCKFDPVTFDKQLPVERPFEGQRSLHTESI